MEALLWQIEGITFGMHSTPEELRLPFHTSKWRQCTVHYMGMKNMVELCWSPSNTRFCPLICFIRKTQLILQVLPYPLNQLGEGLMCSSVYALQPFWSGSLCLANRGAGSWTNSSLLGFRRLISKHTQPKQYLTKACSSQNYQSTYAVHSTYRYVLVC